MKTLERMDDATGTVHEPLWVDFSELDDVWVFASVEWVGIYTCEAKILHLQGEIKVHARFLAVHGADTLAEYIMPSSLNPCVGAPRDRYPPDIAFRFVPNVKAKVGAKLGRADARRKSAGLAVKNGNAGNAAAAQAAVPNVNLLPLAGPPPAQHQVGLVAPAVGLGAGQPLGKDGNVAKNGQDVKAPAKPALLGKDGALPKADGPAVAKAKDAAEATAAEVKAKSP